MSFYLAGDSRASHDRCGPGTWKAKRVLFLSVEPGGEKGLSLASPAQQAKSSLRPSTGGLGFDFNV